VVRIEIQTWIHTKICLHLYLTSGQCPPSKNGMSVPGQISGKFRSTIQYLLHNCRGELRDMTQWGRMTVKAAAPGIDEVE